MRKIILECNVATDSIGSKQTEEIEFEVEDDDSKEVLEQICEEIYQEWLAGSIDSWYVIKSDTKKV